MLCVLEGYVWVKKYINRISVTFGIQKRDIALYLGYLFSLEHGTIGGLLIRHGEKNMKITFKDKFSFCITMEGKEYPGSFLKDAVDQMKCCCQDYYLWKYYDNIRLENDLGDLVFKIYP